MARVHDRDVIRRATHLPIDRKLRPHRGNTRCNAECIAVPPQSKDAFDGCLVHPAGRTRVPRPPAAAEMHRMGIHIRRDGVRLRLVLIDPLWRPRVIDRVDHVEQFHRFVAEAELSQRDDRPQRGVGVLTAVLANSWNIAFDVPGVMRHAIEGRCQQQNYLRVASHQVGPHGFHRARRASRVRALGENRPRLRQRVDSALFALRRAKRCPVVEIRSTIPVAVPRELQHPREPCGIAAIPPRQIATATALAQHGELLRRATGGHQPPADKRQAPQSTRARS